MATHLQKTILLLAGRRHFQNAASHGYLTSVTRAFHNSPVNNKYRPPDVCLSPDKSMILCWHPEPDFPYENTKPLPRNKTEVEEGDSVLKIQYLVDDKLKNRPEGPTVDELAQLFHTYKFTFKRRHRHEKKIDMIKFKPRDREGL